MENHRLFIVILCAYLYSQTTHKYVVNAAKSERFTASELSQIQSCAASDFCIQIAPLNYIIMLIDFCAEVPVECPITMRQLAKIQELRAGELPTKPPATLPPATATVVQNKLNTTLISSLISLGQAREPRCRTTDKMEKLFAKVEALESELKTTKDKLKELEASSKSDLTNVQWQALHIGAAAACRGAVPSGGTGPHVNGVVPRRKGVSCTQTCAATDVIYPGRYPHNYKHCDAMVLVVGQLGKATSYKKAVGWYYNYGCGVVDTRFDLKDASANSPWVAFCCCRA